MTETFQEHIMGLLSPRTPEPFGFKSPDEAARVINIFLNNNEKLRLFDAIAEAVERFPHQSRGHI